MSSGGQLSPSKLVGGLLGDRFRLKKVVGVPGTSTAFLGRDLHSSSEVNVKVLRFDERTDPELFEAALHDAEMLAQITPNPNVVQVLGAGQISTQAVFVALKREQGQSLDEWLADPQNSTQSIGQAAQLSLSLVRGIAHLHRSGVVHGQITPLDFVLSRTSTGELIAKVQNYGISRLPVSTVGQSSFSALGPAPEQVVGQTNSFATDVFAIGALLFEVFADLLALDRPSFPFVARSQNRAPHSPSEEQLVELMQTCLAKQPTNRFQTAQAIVSELELIVANQNPSQPEPLLSSMPQSVTSASIAGQRPGLPASPPVVMNPDPSNNPPILIGQQQGMSNLPESTQHYGQSALHRPAPNGQLLDTMDHHERAKKAKPPKSTHQSRTPQIVLACLAVLATGFTAWWIISDNDFDFLTPAKQVASAALAPPRPAPFAKPHPAPPTNAAPVPAPIPVPTKRTAKVPVSPPKPPVRKAKPQTEKPKAPEISPRPPAYLTNLTDKDIRDALRSTRTRIHASCPRPKDLPIVQAEITVLPSGKVARVRLVDPLPESEVGRCVVRHALETKYPQRARNLPSHIKAAFHWGEKRRASRRRRTSQAFDSL